MGGPSPVRAASGRDPRRQDYVWRPCLDDRSAGVTAERQRTGELTDGGGVRGGNEEDGNEKLGDEHGDVGGVSTGWSMSSKRNPSSLLYPFSQDLIS